MVDLIPEEEQYSEDRADGRWTEDEKRDQL